MPSLPSNVFVSTHPCLLSKLSQLRSSSATPRETRALVHEISLILATEALGKTLIAEKSGETAVTPLGVQFEVDKVTKSIALVPILRSGLGMLEGLFYLIIYRERVLANVECSFSNVGAEPITGASPWSV
jgi:uracil phosphoribosyltransferase